MSRSAHRNTAEPNYNRNAASAINPTPISNSGINRSVITPNRTDNQSVSPYAAVDTAYNNRSMF